jgi:hypothetical protein
LLHNIDKSKIHIISHTQQPFLDRKEAGELLVRELIYLKGKDVVVLGIP